MRVGAKEEFAERLLNNMTWPERILWARLKRRQLDYYFQRQAIVLGFIADFWCQQARVAIEVDGSVHELEKVKAADERKNAAFAQAHIDLLRFTNEEVRCGVSAVLLRIWTHCYERAPLKSFYKAPLGSRREENSDFSAFLQVREAKRLERHEFQFSYASRKRWQRLVQGKDRWGY